MELFRTAAASTYIAFPMINTSGDTLSGLTLTGTWAAWADAGGQGLTAGNGFLTLSGAFPEIASTGVYGGFLAAAELPAASPFVLLRFTATNAATQYLLIRTATIFANVQAFGSGAITSDAFSTGAITAGSIAADAIGASELATDAVAEIADAVWDEVILSAHTTDNTTGLAINRLYHATNYLDVAVSSRSAPATGQTVNVVDTGAITSGSFAAGAIDAAAIAANAIGASEIAADAIGASELATDAVAEIADAIWDEVITSGHTTDNTAGKMAQRLYHATDYLNASIADVPTSAENADAVWDEVILSAHTTDNTTGKAIGRLYHATDYLNASILTIGSTYADDFLGRTVTRGTSGGRTVGQAMMALRNRVAISAGTLTVYSTDDSTAEFTATVATESVSAIVTDINPA